MTTRTAPRTSKKPAMKRVVLAVKIPGAKEVAVTGDFTQWSKEGVALHQIRDGEWCVTLELPAGEHEYRLIVDGEWRDHPEAARRVPNPFGSENCVMIIE